MVLCRFVVAVIFLNTQQIGESVFVSIPVIRTSSVASSIVKDSFICCCAFVGATHRRALNPPSGPSTTLSPLLLEFEE